MGDYTDSFVVDRAPHDVFAAINGREGWWGGTCTEQRQGGDEFTYRVQDIHFSKAPASSRLDPDRKVVWLVLENHMNFVSGPERVGGPPRSASRSSTQGTQTEGPFHSPGIGSPI